MWEGGGFMCKQHKKMFLKKLMKMNGGWLGGGGGGLKTEIVFLYTYCWACNGGDSLLTA